ncbi:hypothetical protein BWI93_01295 [Siphonobacter sp. BAB-5385]|uniref:hypothetical protein n=1 Tax=Siphonobacter sp. BAB-5385 TaxID=1864822 RepID=UPI000B9E206C|nr:hypothetical protein [Siphonobacter sp. BAB-5385]OZI09930.1 hypothetical protein BWI93_01295 [Siphonobacter sp. BAB-5385]
MNDQDNLRAFLRDGPFNLSKASEKMNIDPSVLKNFISRTRLDKEGNVYRIGLGKYEDLIFAYFHEYGYDPEKAYEAVI